MKITKKFKVLSIALFVMIGTTVALNAIVYEPLPNRPEYRGFYYWLDMADYPNLLQSDMPYEVLIGYIVADSVVRAAPGSRIMSDAIRKMNLLTDTAQFIYKYWYAMNEYDPLWFYSFLNKKYPEANISSRSLRSDMRSRMYEDTKFTYVVSDYILHIYVNNTVHIDTSNTKYPEFSKTIAYCKILDILKGGVFPSLDNAIFYNGEQKNSVESGIVDNNYADALVPTIMPDIVFNYVDQWRNGQGGRPLFNQRDGHWIKPNKEYIVFLEFQGVDAVGSWAPVGSIYKQYYTLMPYPHTKSYSMYPIEDGYVIDIRNALGFGTKVPVDEFKENIRKKIEEIKNFGE